jgi:hypothetical protein
MIDSQVAEALRFRVNGIEPLDELYDLDRRLVHLFGQTLKPSRRSRILPTLSLKVFNRRGFAMSRDRSATHSRSPFIIVGSPELVGASETSAVALPPLSTLHLAAARGSPRNHPSLDSPTSGQPREPRSGEDPGVPGHARSGLFSPKADLQALHGL